MENMENNEFVEVVETPVVAQPVVEAQPASNGKGMSIAALVCGIVGIVGSWIPLVSYFTLIPAILGVVFGSKGQKIAKATGEGKGLATAGLVLGIIGTVFGAMGFLCYGCACIAALAAGGL